MEKNIIKQAKADIFKELYTVINFYIKKGAKPQSLKKFYKNNKRFNDVLEDIKNKGFNLINDEVEYKKIVREVLNDILDDFIAKQKDEEYKNKSQKMKHIKEFYQFEVNEEFTTFQNILLSAGAAFCLYKFVKGLLFDILDKNKDKIIAKVDKMALNNLSRRIGEKLEEGKKAQFSEDFVYYTIEFDKNLIIKINKTKKFMTWTNHKGEFQSILPISQEEIDQLIASLKEENNEK